MTKKIIKIVDATNGVELEREMSSEELAQWEQDKIQQKLQAAQQQANEEARQSALEKLAALGLTEAEIKALAG